MRASSGIICILLFVSATVFSQSRTIVFSYDNSGNRTGRAIEISGGLKSLLLADPLQTPLKAEPGMTMILYPNPTGGMLTLEIQEEPEGDYYMSVTDISGVVLLHRPVNGPYTTVDLSLYPAGTYFVRVISEGRRQYFKILKF